MEEYKNVFISALGSTNLTEVTYSKKSSSEVVTRIYAPVDIGTWRKFHNCRNDYYHFYDLESKHPVPLLPEQILTIELLDKKFEPADFIHWTPDWHIVRDWGVYS